MISVAIGLWVRVPRPLAIAGNAILALALIPVIAHLASPERNPVQADRTLELEQKLEAVRYQRANQGLSYNGGTVTTGTDTVANPDAGPNVDAPPLK